MDNKNVVYNYMFRMKNGQVVNFEVDVDLDYKNCGSEKYQGKYEDIVHLDFHKCENCPYSKRDTSQCPVLVRTIKAIEKFDTFHSDEIVDVIINGPNRSYIKKSCSLQVGLQSLLGLLMGSSNCFHFHFFRPMAYHHLPFADIKETLTRVIGTNLLRHMITGTNKTYEDTLKEVNSSYKSIEIVNRSLVNRINAFQKKDASKNAIVILDSFAKIFSLEFSTDLTIFDNFFKKENIVL